jgi:hypothetical protein
MKRFVGYVLDKAIKSLPRKKKVSPDIKSVKPTKDIKGSVDRVKSAEYSKRIDATNKSKSKIDEGKKMMREGQKELRRMIDTKRAFKFKHGTTKQKTFPIKPGKDPKKEHKGLVEEKATGGRVGKMGGGMMGRRMGYSQGSNNGKPISRSKNPGILAMSKTAKGRKVVKERFKFNPNRIVAKKGGKA